MANSQRYHREIRHRYRLEAQKFDSGYVTLARRYIDPTTGSKNYEEFNLKGEGTILTYTIVHIPADAYGNEAPFPIAIIETEEGARLTCQIVDCEHSKIKIGGRVKLVFRKIIEEGHSGIINYGYKALLI